MSTEVSKDTAQKKYDYLSENLFNVQEYARRLHEQVKQSLHAIDRLTENNQALRRKNKALVKHIADQDEALRRRNKYIADQDEALRRRNKYIAKRSPPKGKDCPACQAKTPLPPADGERRCWSIPLDYPKLAELEKELKVQVDAALPPAPPPAPPPKKQDMPWRGDRQLDNLEAALHPPADEMSAGIRQHDSLVDALRQTTKAPKRRHIHVTVNGKVMEWVQVISPEGMSPSCAIGYVREPEAAPADSRPRNTLTSWMADWGAVERNTVLRKVLDTRLEQIKGGFSVPLREPKQDKPTGGARGAWGEQLTSVAYLLPEIPYEGTWVWLDKEHPQFVEQLRTYPEYEERLALGAKYPEQVLKCLHFTMLTRLGRTRTTWKGATDLSGRGFIVRNVCSSEDCA